MLSFLPIRFLLLLLLFCTACTTPASANLENTGTLVVGTVANFPPFAITTPGQSADGFTVDLWKEVAKQAGVESYVVQVRPWGELLHDFKKGKIDVLINIAWSEERALYTDFSVPHATVHGAIFVRAKESEIRSEADLRGKSIIVVNSDLAHEYAVSQGWGDRLVIVNSAEQGLKLLASGGHDAMLLNRLTGIRMIKSLKIDSVRPIDASAGFGQKFCFGVRKGNSDLLSHINEGLALTKANGVYDDIYRKWFGIYEVKEPTWRDILPYLAPVAALALVGAAFGLYNRRKEQRRAKEALAASEENLRLILDTAGEAIYGVDMEGNCTFCNAACIRMLGYRHAEELLGRNMHALLHHSHADGSPHLDSECHIMNSINTGKGSIVDDDVVWRADGTSFMAEYRSYPQMKQGKAVGAVVTFVDITERRLKESAHQQAASLIQQATAHTNLHDCMAALTASLQQWAALDAVGILLRERDELPYHETFGPPPSFDHTGRCLCAHGPDGDLRRDTPGNPLLECICGEILSGRTSSSLPSFTSRGSFWSNNLPLLQPDGHFQQARLQNRCNTAGYHSVAIVPMHAGDEIIGVVQFKDRHQDRFTASLIEVFETLADRIALALTRRRAEQELQKYEKLHHDLLDTIPDLIWLKDPDGVYLLCNTTFERLFGAKEEEIVGRTDYDYVEKELADFFREHDRKAMEKGSASCNEEWITFADDGRRALLQTIKTPMFDSKGKLVGILGIGRDITELRQAEEAMRQSEVRLRYALEGTNDGLWDIQLSDGKTHLSGRSCEILGYTAKELEGVRVWSDLVHPEDHPVTQERMQAHREGRSKQFEAEHRLLTKSGSWKWVHTRGKIVERENDGTPVRITGTFSDITEKKSLEWQLHQAQKMESVGRLAGGVAHDFNNMLGVIIGHAALALMDTDPAHPTHGHLVEIDKAAERSADLTRQLLAFARQQTVVPRVLDLNDTIGGMLRMLQRLIGEDIKLSWHPAQKLPLIKMDPSQIDQILANLSVNARDAIADIGEIVIETGSATVSSNYCLTRPDALPGEYVWLSVTDNGRGMDRETISHIYEPFFTTKAMGEGTGLGLATVYGAVKQNNGFIDVESEIGRGTTFTIYIPKHGDRTEENLKEAESAPLPRGSETILLVEDEPSILKMAALILETQGYTALAAGDPREALRIASEHQGPIHLLMTDVIMPEMNGKDLAAAVTAMNPGVKRLFMSGYTADVIAHHGVLDEGLHFIQKPFSLSDLAKKVREVLEAD